MGDHNCTTADATQLHVFRNSKRISHTSHKHIAILYKDHGCLSILGQNLLKG